MIVGMFLTFAMMPIEKNLFLKKVRRIFFILLLISLPLTLINGIRSARQLKLSKKYAAYVLETASHQQPDQFIEGYLFGSPISQNVNKTVFMEEHKYSVFAHPHYTIPGIISQSVISGSDGHGGGDCDPRMGRRGVGDGRKFIRRRIGCPVG